MGLLLRLVVGRRCFEEDVVVIGWVEVGIGGTCGKVEILALSLAFIENLDSLDLSFRLVMSDKSCPDWE